MDWRSHLDSLETVFKRLAEANLTLNLAKCEFAQATITYLGKQIGHGQGRPLEEKITAIIQFPPPKTRLGHLYAKRLSTILKPCCVLLLCLEPLILPSQLEVDASGVGAGAVLLQEDENGVDHPVCYFSRKFNKHQLGLAAVSVIVRGPVPHCGQSSSRVQALEEGLGF
ncbi:hypothetical protein SRHO_G00211540 [Serrasalmus rhombeus]